MSITHPYELDTFEWEVAPEGVSGLVCDCGHTPTLQFTREHAAEKQIVCESCGEPINNGELVRVIHTDAALLRNPNEVTARTWYHATHRKNWFDDILAAKPSRHGDSGNLMIHMGNRDASLDRIFTAKSSDEWYLFEITLKPDTPVDEDVHDDNFCDALDWTGSTRYLADGVTRYVNAYEGIGSISLLVNPAYIQSVSSRQIDVAEEQAKRLIAS